MHFSTSFAAAATVAASLILAASAHAAQPVPGYTPPVAMTKTPDYADDTRGVFVPGHTQPRLRTEQELVMYRSGQQPNYVPVAGSVNTRTAAPIQVAQARGAQDATDAEMDRLAGDAPAAVPPGMGSLADRPAAPMMVAPMPMIPQGRMVAPGAPMMVPMAPAPMAVMPHGMGAYAPTPVNPEAGVEIAVGEVQRRAVDMQNSLVRLHEDRITIRRALQRMMDQIGASDWTTVWDLAEQNAALPDMEISVYAEEPFMNVMNALLARIQTRSGQPLRVIRYDNASRIVITDRSGGHRLAGDKVSPIGVDTKQEAAVTEKVLREAMVSLHYDEIPLVDALENVVNQAGKGQWRLRIYAGVDQVLKPAHIEEPFSVAMERLLRLFNLKYEIFPGGKLVVVTGSNRLGFSTGVQK